MSYATVIFIAGWTGGLIASLVPWQPPIWRKALIVMAISLAFRCLGEWLA